MKAEDVTDTLALACVSIWLQHSIHDGDGKQLMEFSILHGDRPVGNFALVLVFHPLIGLLPRLFLLVGFRNARVT